MNKKELLKKLSAHNSDLRFNISSEDYFELERIFRFKTVEKKNAQEEVA